MSNLKCIKGKKSEREEVKPPCHASSICQEICELCKLLPDLEKNAVIGYAHRLIDVTATKAPEPGLKLCKEVRNDTII